MILYFNFLAQNSQADKISYLLQVPWMQAAAFPWGLHRSLSVNLKELQTVRNFVDLVDQCHCLGAKAEVTICHSR